MTHHASTIYLDQQALRRNLHFIREQLAPGTRLSSVVKGNAYGHGITSYVPMAVEEGVSHFSVYNAQEAQQVKQSAPAETEVMVMGYVHPEDVAWCIQEDVSFYVFDKDRLEQAVTAARQAGKKARIHLELETGMNRTGFRKDQLQSVADTLHREADHLTLEGVCTHFAGAESIANYVRIKQQKQRFRMMLKWLSEKGLQPKYRHANCSAAMIRHPDMNLDMVRIGILQYGFWPSKETFIEYTSRHHQPEDPLWRVISWKSRIMDVKSVAKGEYIGYGNSFLAQQDMQIATVPVGYANGYSRALSNQGRALVHGQRVNVIGIVNMNVIMLDITQVDHANSGDEVTLIGRQDNESITVDSFSELSSQLNYELLTRLPVNIPRLIQ